MNEYIVEIIYSQYGEETVFKEKLVRCKDCKYSVDEYGYGDCYCDYDRNLSYIGKNWNHYCGFAERKEE